jgi:Ca2+-binding EF-hand superfamily protein
VQAIWDAVDVDGSGSLDADEMREVLARLGQVMLRQPPALACLSALCESRVSAVYAPGQTPSDRAFQKMFEKLDPRGSGQVRWTALTNQVYNGGRE